MQNLAPRKIFVPGPSGNYLNWTESQRTDDITKADAVMFTGGTDVNPACYGKKRHPMTEASDDARDAKEKEIFELARAMNKPMIGICRGAQFLCVMAGGTLVQHQHHPAHHYMQVSDGRSLKITSDHHQRQFPFDNPRINWRLYGWCNPGFSPFSHGQSTDEDLSGQKEVEVAYYSDIKALAIQSHPEWAFPCQSDEDFASLHYFRTMLNRLILGQL